MREILFRAKRRNGEWREGSLMFYPDVNRAYMSSGEFKSIGGIVEVDKNTIGQYTGLKDINGNRIFEGDIVECFSSDYVGRPKIDTIKVKDMTDYNTMVYLNCSNELEIIGNIQDSPNFWKEGVDNV